MILKEFYFVAFFAGVKASSFCIYLSILSSMHSICSSRRMESFLWSLTVWPARGLNNFSSVASIFRLCEAVEVQFSYPYKNVRKTKVLCNFKIVSVFTFIKKIVLLIVPINCKNFANLSFSWVVAENRFLLT
jgi:hypothetical protein